MFRFFLPIAYKGKLSTFKLSNTLNRPITIRWLLNDIQKSTNISANSNKMFYFYMPDTVKHIGLSAVMAETNTPVPLNGQNVHQYKLDEEEDVGEERNVDNQGQSSDGNNSGDDKDGNDDAKRRSPTTKSLVVKGIKYRSDSDIIIYYNLEYPDSIDYVIVLCFFSVFIFFHLIYSTARW